MSILICQGKNKNEEEEKRMSHYLYMIIISQSEMHVLEE